MQKLSAERVPKCLNADLKVKGASRLSNFWNFFGVIQIISCRYWWSWTKPGCITMTRRQSNNQWSSGIAAHATLKNYECKNPLKKFSPRFILGSRRHPPPWLCSKGPNYQRGLLLIFAGVIEGHFEGKMPRECHQGRSCSCTAMPRLTGHLQHRRNWPTWASNVLITHPILRICPHRDYHLFPGLKGRHSSSDAEVIAAAETWLDGQTSEFFYFVWLAKVGATS